ncbi:6790_t:CDS:2, partial [Gigaspora margarita]
DYDSAAIRADKPIPPQYDLFYFEATIVSKGQNGIIGTGFYFLLEEEREKAKWKEEHIELVERIKAAFRKGIHQRDRKISKIDEQEVEEKFAIVAERLDLSMMKKAQAEWESRMKEMNRNLNYGICVQCKQDNTSLAWCRTL